MNSFDERWGDEWEAESPNQSHRDAHQQELHIGGSTGEGLAPGPPPRTKEDSEEQMNEEKDEPREEFRREPAQPGPASHWAAIIAAVLACALLISLGYDWHERNTARNLTRDLASQQQDMSAALNQARSQIDALTAKMNSINIPPAQATATPPAVTRSLKRAARRPRVAEDRRWKNMQDQLAAQQKEIDTQQQSLEQARTELANNLNSTKDELDGSIAKTHDELVALEKKGERNYYEFDLTKSKQFKHVGSISLSLRKTNTKHAYFDLAMIVDDFKLDKKHVNLYEPVLVYPSDSQQALELVANRIDKNGIHGYVSEPKYKESASAAAGATAGSGGITPTAGPAPNSSPANTTGAQESGDSAPADKPDAGLQRRPEPNL
jgi:hypothetical protein